MCSQAVQEGQSWNQTGTLVGGLRTPRLGLADTYHCWCVCGKQGGNFTAAMAPWKKKKKSYGHSGLCAPGPVSVVSLPWITVTWVHSSHSQYLQWACGSCRWTLIITMTSRESLSLSNSSSITRQKNNTYSTGAQASSASFDRYADLCGRIRFGKVGNGSELPGSITPKWNIVKTQTTILYYHSKIQVR